MFGTGLIFDTITFLFIVIPFVLVLTLVTDKFFKSRFRKKASFIIYSILTVLLIFNNISEYLFWDEFGVRYNFIAVDYLIYTNEVLNNIYESYSITLITTILIFFSLIGILVLRFFHIISSSVYVNDKPGRRYIQGAVLLLFPVILYFGTGMSLSDISTNRYNRELSKNGLYSLVYAFKVNTLNYNEFYNTKKLSSTIDAVKKDLDINSSANNNIPLSRYVSNSGEEKNYNVFLINVESLSGEYMSYINRAKHIDTPVLDSLSEKSLFFTNFYASGTRTVRGLEAITLSIPPTPGRSVVKRPNNENLFSLGKVFNKKGYKSKFIYGGHGYFDNMNYFFSKNGYEIIDRTDIADKDISFSNAWGVCDHDLYNRAVKEADKMHDNKSPFFFHILTTSNHRPYTFPEVGREFKQDREGGVEYTDYAIGELFKSIKTKPWFKNTIFVIIADHCGGSAGRSELPIGEYQIPMIIYNPHIITPQKVDKLSCQIDFGPTLLGLMNWSYHSEFMGKDIFKMKPEDERAFIGNYQKLGYIKNDKLLILSPQNRVSCFKFNRYNCDATPVNVDQSMQDISISYYQLASHLFSSNKPL